MTGAVDRTVLVFIASRGGGQPRRRVLWRMSAEHARAVCSDPRTGIGAHPDHMLCWTEDDTPGTWRFIRDNGRYGQVLDEVGAVVFEAYGSAADL